MPLFYGFLHGWRILDSNLQMGDTSFRSLWKNCLVMILAEFLVSNQNKNKLKRCRQHHFLPFSTVLWYRFGRDLTRDDFRGRKSDRHRRYTIRKPVKNWFYGNFPWTVCGQEKIRKTRTEGRSSFSLLAFAVPVLGLVEKASLNGCFWISFLLMRTMAAFLFFCVGPLLG